MKKTIGFTVFFVKCDVLVIKIAGNYNQGFVDFWAKKPPCNPQELIGKGQKLNTQVYRAWYSKTYKLMTISSSEVIVGNSGNTGLYLLFLPSKNNKIIIRLQKDTFKISGN